MLSLQAALTSLERMTEVPPVENIIYILQKCREKKSLACAKRLHAYMCENELEEHRTLGNYLVPMLVGCGSLDDAQQVFNRLKRRNQYSWNSLILGYVDCGESQHAFHLYHNMQEDSVHPDRYTFVALLKACARLTDVERGREIRDEIAKRGMESDLFVGSTLVDMFGKCGALTEAQQAFDKLPVRNVVSWSALMAGYAENGLGKEALSCFEQMQLEGISPNAVTFVSTLKACGLTGATDRGRQVRAEIAKRGLEHDLFVGSTLVDMFGKCGSLAEAREAFDKLLVRDVVSWNALMAGYAERGPGEEVLSCLKQMQLEGISPDSFTFVCSLKACSSMRAIGRGQEICAEITRKGLERDSFVGNMLVDMFSKCGSLAEAQEVFDTLTVRDIVSWNVLISEYAENGLGKEVLNCYELMQVEGMSPDTVTFACSLKAYGNMGAIERGREILVEITQRGLERDVFVSTAVVDMFVKGNLLAEGQEVFNKLAAQNAVSWNALITGYSEQGLDREVLNCFEQMQLEGISPDSVTYVCILKAFSRIGAMEGGQGIHAELARKGLERDKFSATALVDMVGKCGSIVESQEIFDKQPVHNVVLWNALITGYSEHGLVEDVLDCFDHMQLEDLSPDPVTFVCSLKACGSLGALDRGQELHCEITKMGLERVAFVGSMLVDMYGKCGSISEAREVFDRLLVPDVACWNALINGYGMNHDGHMAVRCFEDMQEQGIKPNAVSFICLLVACSHASLVLEGRKYFKVMREGYEIEPTVDHHACMVDLLARSGHVYEAERFVETVKCPPSKQMWTALLSACKIYGEVELGLRCFQHLVQMTPEDSSAYVLMANIYASAGQWDDANRIDELRKNVGAKKKPANVLLEVNKQVHEFVVGNKQTNEVAGKVEYLCLQMKDEGYVPNLDLVLKDFSDEGMEAVSYEYAEEFL